MRTLAVVIALVLVPTAAWAQGLGLDLSDDAQKKEKEQPPPPKEDTSLTPDTLGKPEDRPVKKEPLLGEKEITQEDRVKAVQRKVYLKTHRFELAGFFGATINDPFYLKTGESLKLSYFFSDAVGVGVRVMPMQVYPTDDVSRAKRAFSSRIFSSSPELAGLVEVEWSPLYGKATIFNSIIHFDGYILGGAGLVQTATSHATGGAPRFGSDLGIGLRFAVKDYLAVNAAYVNLSYVDQPSGTTKTSLQNLQMPMVGLSLFLPFKSTGRESE